MKINPKQEKFCQAWCESGNATQSYREATGASDPVSATMGWRWLRKDDIKARIDEIRKENRELCTLTRSELLDYAADALLTPIGAIDEHSPLCEEISHSEHGKKLKMFSKAAAFEKIVKMCGYNEPEEVKVSLEEDLLGMLRGVNGDAEE